MPCGSEVVEIDTPPWAGFTTRDRAWLTDFGGSCASVTCTLNVDVPAIVGVPLIVPPELKLRPAGKEPLEMFQKYGEFPPVAVRVVLYAVLTVPMGSELVAMLNGEGGLRAFCNF